MPNFMKPPGAPWTFNALLFLAVGIALLWLGIDKGQVPGLGGGVWSLLLAAGLWRKGGWTRLGTTATSLVVAAWAAYLWATMGFAWSHLLLVVFGPWAAWQFWRELAPADASSRPMISLVLLLARPRYLEAPVLAEALKDAWNLDFKVGGEEEEPADESAGPFVLGESPIFMVGTGDAMFLIHNHAVPYFNDIEELLDKIPELRRRKIVADHQAWLSVDCMWTSDGIEEGQYSRIATALAALADDSVLGLFQPETHWLTPWDADLEDRLRKGENLEELFRINNVPVVQISDDDPRMKAAVAEARRRWPEFVDAFQARLPGGNYAVKAAVTREGNTEFIWLEVIGLEPDYIHGTLANDPVDLGGLKLGDQVEVPLSDLNDWTFSHRQGEEPAGLFTVKVLTEAWKQRVEEADKPE
jgi:uncharacterized protein YegJ (DUF2314 family)